METDGQGAEDGVATLGTPKSHGFSGVPPSAALEGGAHRLRWEG